MFFEFQCKLEHQQQQIDKLRGGRQLVDNTAGISQRQSNVADSEVPADNAQMIDGGLGYPVDGIKEQTTCDLHVEFRKISLKVAVDFALPPLGPEGKPPLWHGHEIPAGYAYVGVDQIVPSLSRCSLKSLDQKVSVNSEK